MAKFVYFGGKGWIRTIEDIVDGFTVRCIWPLCNLPKWSWRKESNLQPADYKSAALPLSHASKTLKNDEHFSVSLCQENPCVFSFSPSLFLCILCMLVPKRESNHRHCFTNSTQSLRAFSRNHFRFFVVLLRLLKLTSNFKNFCFKKILVSFLFCSKSFLMHTLYAGALRWNRTTDTRIFSPLLYRLSYQGKIYVLSLYKEHIGDSDGARTHDL